MAAARSAVAQYTKSQPDIDIPVLPSDPPKDKTVVFQTCPLPVCLTALDATKDAVKLLGWKLVPVQTEYTPEAYQGAWTQIEQLHPDAIINQPFVPNSFIAKPLQWVADQKIPLVQFAPADATIQDPVKAVSSGPPLFDTSGQLMGDIVVADAGGPAKTVFLWDPNSLAWVPARDAFTKVVEGAGGSVDILKIDKKQTGKEIPTQVVSYIQAHPDVRYIALGLADVGAGVPQALKAAGLADKVKIVSRAPNQTTLQEVQSGDQFATVAEESAASAWRNVDQLVRLLMGVPLGDLQNPDGWHQIFYKEQVTPTVLATSPASLTPGIPAAFEKAWRVGS